ncbi:nickel pincer cofactor biosynthesis protein LarB [Nitrospina watsonii]|uniref:Pyridinium-3,5-biscarboxylic acid mononucleotide synthase n=1 Tax=Nitrospina watsonii TaxID=1323948 RepID=A0ABM9HDS7_9BACT|nr:nickel pincer cofactor biosynthesis protein LarB [Nitrospina watsonii]CAI2718381.1 Pyridinium-3,5-biscarboxylic acid mononucleotide synthase [Nitrospina watsonii]
MNPLQLHKLLNDLYTQKVRPDTVLEQLRTLPFEDLGFAHVDHHRPLRNGMAEVIYCEGKTPAQISGIIKKQLKAGCDILATRLAADSYRKMKKDLPAKAVYNAEGRVLTIQKNAKKKRFGQILIVTAGTSDLPVAEEAMATADLLGSNVEKIVDVGVAGIHRILDKIDRLRKARVIVVVAGMDGALLSVVGGLVDCPVIGVPTSVGYGASFGGVAALLTMLNSCSTGVGAVNIDNGFGAACLAHRINMMGG